MKARSPPRTNQDIERKNTRMKKQALVIDTPPNCAECPLSLDIAGVGGKPMLNVNRCFGCGKINVDSETKPAWCPLRDIEE